MKRLVDRVIDRALSLLGLEIDVSFHVSSDRVSQITDTLYLGARPRPEDTAALKTAGITHVVSCLREDECSRVAFLQADFRNLQLAVHDGVHEDIAATFPRLFEFAREAHAACPRARLLLHCEAGVSRSATLAIALLMKAEGLTFLDAFRVVRTQRAHVLPNIGFASQLQRLEFALRPAERAVSSPSSLARFLHEACNAPVEPELLQTMLERHDYNALLALQAIFGREIPRVIQGVRL